MFGVCGLGFRVYGARITSVLVSQVLVRTGCRVPVIHWMGGTERLMILLIHVPAHLHARWYVYPIKDISLISRYPTHFWIIGFLRFLQ